MLKKWWYAAVDLFVRIRRKACNHEWGEAFIAGYRPGNLMLEPVWLKACKKCGKVIEVDPNMEEEDGSEIR